MQRSASRKHSPLHEPSPQPPASALCDHSMHISGQQARRLAAASCGRAAHGWPRQGGSHDQQSGPGARRHRRGGLAGASARAAQQRSPRSDGFGRGRGRIGGESEAPAWLSRLGGAAQRRRVAWDEGTNRRAAARAARGPPASVSLHNGSGYTTDPASMQLRCLLCGRRIAWAGAPRWLKPASVAAAAPRCGAWAAEVHNGH